MSGTFKVSCCSCGHRNRWPIFIKLSMLIIWSIKNQTYFSSEGTGRKQAVHYHSSSFLRLLVGNHLSGQWIGEFVTRISWGRIQLRAILIAFPVLSSMPCHSKWCWYNYLILNYLSIHDNKLCFTEANCSGPSYRGSLWWLHYLPSNRHKKWALARFYFV